MRIKSQWFKDDAHKSAADIASAAAFIVWRVAQNALKTMRAAGYELPPGEPYFAFLAEFLAFLVAAADRIAYRQRDAAWRIEFTNATANRVGETLAGNQADLLAADSADAYKRRFIELVNLRNVDYADHQWTDAGPDYGFIRCFGHCVAETMAAHDRTWAVSQVIEVEAPEAIEMLQKAMAGLLGETPRRARRSAASRGE
ncbi:hypothetical protein BURK1_03772 [Burkholderiales bacterium]|nr:hypothetical protein BURK1_03772 [Burkholderiales bacterium]